MGVREKGVGVSEEVVWVCERGVCVWAGKRGRVREIMRGAASTFKYA